MVASVYSTKITSKRIFWDVSIDSGIPIPSSEIFNTTVLSVDLRNCIFTIPFLLLGNACLKVLVIASLMIRPIGTTIVVSSAISSTFISN